MKYFLFSIALLFSLSFSVKAQPIDRFTVAQDGSGDFTTVQQAVNAVPDHRKKTTEIFIKKGIYKEKIVVAGSKKMVRFIGEDKNQTILTYDDFAAKKNKFGEEIGTSGSASIYIYGDGFSAENLTFQNSSGPVGQAVAVWVTGDFSKFERCKFLGFQDTLYTYGGNSKQYYKDCYIEGTTDFIFGSATAVFEGCEIFCKKGGRYITAASTPDTCKYGYVFLNCKISGDAPDHSVNLGRPWRPFAKTVFLYCDLSKVIIAGGWDHWSKESNKQTAYYAEYKNTGKGYVPEKRQSWSHQLTEKEAEDYTVKQILGQIP